MPSVVSAADLQEFLDREIRTAHPIAVCHLEASEPLRLVLSAAFGSAEPGGTWPATLIIVLADLALRAAIRAQGGSDATATATNLAFNFLRQPSGPRLIADCRLLKLGRRLAVGEVTLHAEGGSELLCHGTGTYAIQRQN